MSTKCPTCLVEMRLVRFGDLEVDQCERCDGIWFDDGEPERFVTVASRGALEPIFFDDPSDKVPPGQRKCPRCNILMRVWEWGETHVDVCPECRGLWLDRWELQKIMG
ncbi:MAG: zf-TFIIB domain-containing protein [Candidatus Eremiobacterota bacterium]